METLEVPFGMRRYPLAMVFFLGGGAGFIAWSRNVHAAMFVFPLGHLEAPSARIALLVIGLLAIVFAAMLSYVRFVKRPVVVLGEDAISIPMGEFAQTTITLRPGDISSIEETGPRAGGWRTCRVRHRGGELALLSSQLPSDEAFFTIRDRLRALAERPKV